MKTRTKRICLIALLATAICVSASMAVKRTFFPTGSSRRSKSHELTSLSQLLGLPDSALAGLDVGRVNLLCAEGLPGNERADLEDRLKQVDEWSARISAETRRHWYRLDRNPAEFNRSEGYFRMLMMSVVLAEDFQVHYDSTLRTGQPGGAASDGFFKDASLVFPSGLLGAGRKGTCSSLPVLYVAIGRRLGYPLHLVTAKGHLFVRWDGRGERFNVEATSHGLNTFDDEYYRKWPLPITPDEEAAEGYLKNLDSAGELAVFLSIRGMCLRDNGRLNEAAQAFAAAAQLAPNCRAYTIMRAQLARQAQTWSSVTLTLNKGTSP